MGNGEYWKNQASHDVASHQLGLWGPPWVSGNKGEYPITHIAILGTGDDFPG
jgi:hypothetical protein